MDLSGVGDEVWQGTPNRPSPAAGQAPRSVGVVTVRASVLSRLLDQIDYGMLLVTDSGAVRFANQQAWRELSRNGPLCIETGHLKTRLATDQETLRSALDEAARGLRRLVSLRYKGRALVVAVLPVASDDADRESGEALALLTFGKRSPCETLSVDFFARSHGLTGAEARILQALCIGKKPMEIADQSGVAISTVRSHVRSIRLKTQSGNLRELVQRLAVLPPITSAMKAVRAY
ncbi:MAG: LuxR C-terminal-related transcriptional regulator [Burkholderiaceae bacterium]